MSSSNIHEFTWKDDWNKWHLLLVRVCWSSSHPMLAILATVRWTWIRCRAGPENTRQTCEILNVNLVCAKRSCSWIVWSYAASGQAGIRTRGKIR